MVFGFGTRRIRPILGPSNAVHKPKSPKWPPPHPSIGAIERDTPGVISGNSLHKLGQFQFCCWPFLRQDLFLFLSLINTFDVNNTICFYYLSLLASKRRTHWSTFLGIVPIATSRVKTISLFNLSIQKEINIDIKTSKKMKYIYYKKSWSGLDLQFLRTELVVVLLNPKKLHNN